MKRDIHIFDNEDKMDDFIIQKWVEETSRAVGEKNYFTVALSGGRSPVSFYHKLSQLKDILPWEKTHVFLADERLVSLESEDSNYKLIKDNLLSRVGIAMRHVYPVSVEKEDAEVAAQGYEEQLKEFFKLKRNELPRFDLIMLGLGEDGHTASLFPGTDMKGRFGTIAVPAAVKGVKHKRVSLSLPVINNARNVIFIVKGENKSDIARKVLEEDTGLPAALIKTTKGKVYFLLDTGSASKISQSIKK